jgi:hypothetical protein
MIVLKPRKKEREREREREEISKTKMLGEQICFVAD